MSGAAVPPVRHARRGERAGFSVECNHRGSRSPAAASTKRLPRSRFPSIERGRGGFRVRMRSRIAVARAIGSPVVRTTPGRHPWPRDVHRAGPGRREPVVLHVVDDGDDRRLAARQVDLVDAVRHRNGRPSPRAARRSRSTSRGPPPRCRRRPRPVAQPRAHRREMPAGDRDERQNPSPRPRSRRGTRASRRATRATSRA